MNDKLNALIGKHIKSPEAKAADWLGYWPEIDESGTILHIYDGDSIPDNAFLVDWDEAENHPIHVDGDYGFEAIIF